MDALVGLSNSFTTEERREAQDLEFKIDQVTQIIIVEKKSLESNFVKLSAYINEMRSKKYWLLGNYKSFGDYLESIEKRFNLGKSQLYVGMTVTRNLLPSMAEEDIVEIGITKAKVLAKYVEQSGQTTIPEDILAVARDSTKTVEQLDAEVNAQLHNVPHDRGKWFSLGGFFVTEDERKEIEDTLALASATDPVIPNNIAHWQQLKEQMLRLCREFSNVWAGG